MPKKYALLAFLLSLISTYSFLTPQGVSVEEKELSLALASTDCPPYSIEQTLIDAISKATTSIHVAIYAIQDRSIIHALKTAASDRHVHVTVVVDPSASPNAEFLLGKDVHVISQKMRGLMHSKLIVIDDKVVWYGTMNFTRSSLVLHGNMACGVFSPHMAAVCKEYISCLARKKAMEASLATLRTQSQPNGPRIFFSLHPSGAEASLKELLSRIERAKKRIFVAMYTFTHHEIAQALIDAKKRNIDVRVLFDNESSRQTSRPIYLKLKRAGVPCGVRTKDGLLHYKCALIDDSLVVGSANWTKAAFTNNAETFSIIDDVSPERTRFLSEWWQRIEKDATPINA